MPGKRSKDTKQPDAPDAARVAAMVAESRIVVFDGLPIRPSLDRGLSEIRDIMKREGLIFCLLLQDDKIYFLPGGKQE